MCLVLLAHRALAEFPLVLATNRDEYFARPSAPAAWWRHEGVDIFGARDLDKGGTWLGLTRSGRFAVVTNVRDLSKPPPSDAASRGWLVADALAGDAFARADRSRFPSFNLLVGEGDTVRYFRDDAEPALVAPGVHGLSNHRLDTRWPKVSAAVRTFESLRTVDSEALFRILADDARAPDDDLPATGVPLEVERALSPAFVRLPALAYGTRCSTVILGRAGGGFDFEERTFDATGALAGTVREHVA
ncbi:MAG TPA: NRDE family protein [Polyangiaceae bacterium]